MANRFRHAFPNQLKQFIADKNRYVIKGSSGQSQWTDSPWIAIMDKLVTKSPKAGFYPVLLFRGDMEGAYLSLNQGVDKLKQDFKKKSIHVLKLKAEEYRSKLAIKNQVLLSNINLNSSAKNAPFYEAGNILAKYYPKNKLPTKIEFQEDIVFFLKLYDELIFSTELDETSTKLTGIEYKRLRLHYRIERSSSVSKEVKKRKGHICEACNMSFENQYGQLGKDYIEAHHLTPISSINLETFEIDYINDFAVLCSNCHRMIHRLEDPSDLDLLRTILKSNRI